MRKALAAVVVVALILGGLYFGFRPSPTEPVLLAYKYREGGVNVYRTNARLKLDDPSSNSAKALSQTHAARTTQKVLSVKKDGSAEIDMSFSTVGTPMITMRPMPFPDAVTLTVSRTGRIQPPADVSARASLLTPGKEFIPTAQINFAAILPREAVEVGESWEETVPFPVYGGRIHVTATLVSDDYKLGKRTVCKIENRYEGRANLSEFYKKSMTGSLLGGVFGSISGEMRIEGGGALYFSREEGRIIASDDTIRIETKTTMGRSAGSSGSKTGMSVEGTTVADIRSSAVLVGK